MTEIDHHADRADVGAALDLDPNLPISFQLNDIPATVTAAAADVEESVQVIAARSIGALAQGALALLGGLDDPDKTSLALAALIEAVTDAHDAFTEMVDVAPNDPAFSYDQFPLLVHGELPHSARPHLTLGRALRISPTIGPQWFVEVLGEAAGRLALATAIANTQASLHGAVQVDGDVATQLAAVRSALASTAAAIGAHGGVAA